jgi:hypothetical protein
MNFIVKEKKFRIGEIPIVFFDRHLGTTKMSLGIAVEAAVIVWLLSLRRITVPVKERIETLKHIIVDMVQKPVEKLSLRTHQG